MFNIIWISEFNKYLIENKINLDIYDYIDYIADSVGHNFNNNFIKYLLKLDQLNTSNADLEKNKFCISSYEFELLHITKDKDIKNIIKKAQLKLNRDYIIVNKKKDFYISFQKIKKYIIYIHMHIKCVY